MQELVLTGYSTLGIQDVPRPEPGLIKVVLKPEG